jgi:micrococcal nuclease
MQILWTVLLHILFVSHKFAADFFAPVVYILDGDTIEVLHNKKRERIRLNGIDCPENGQAFGTRAKQAISVLIFGKEVTVHTHGKDRYGRSIADVLLPDGRWNERQL